MTYMPCRLLAVLALLAGVAGTFAPGNAHAAQSYDACTGFIDSVPTTITQQGVWCLRKDVTTNMTSGSAITIATNNVTIDCNDFKVGGLGAGSATRAYGIYASQRQNLTVRNCNVRGFAQGVRLQSGAGHLIEDNRFDNNLYYGIAAISQNTRVQRNRVYDTGGGANNNSRIYGILAYADIIDNTVAGVFSEPDSVYGIYTGGKGLVVRNNAVRDLESVDGTVSGIEVSSPGVRIDGNVVAASTGYGIKGFDLAKTACSNNVIVGFNVALIDCADAGNNTVLSP